MLLAIHFWLSTTIGAFSFALAALFCWALFLRYRKDHQPVFAALAGIFLTLGLVFYIFIIQRPLPWIVVVSFAAILLYAVYEVFQNFEQYRNVIYKTSTVLLAITLVSACAVYSESTFREKRRMRLTDDINTEIVISTRLLAQFVEGLANDTGITKAISDRQVDALRGDFSRYVTEQRLDSLLITDGLGTIVVSSSTAQPSGSDVVSTNPWLAETFRGKAVSTISYDQLSGRPQISAAYPITTTSELSAIIIATKGIDDSMLSEWKTKFGHGYVVGSDFGYYQAAQGRNDKETSRLKSPATLSALVDAQLTRKPYLKLDNGVGTTQVVVYTIPTSNAQHPLIVGITE